MYMSEEDFLSDAFGKVFRICDSGDTHSEFMSGIIIGCPKGVFIDYSFVDKELARRSPSNDKFSTHRAEIDKVIFDSGIENGYTTGDIISYRIPNSDVKINEDNRFVLKPSHASFTYMKKYGFTDNELCGRASARQTVCRVVAGAIAKLCLLNYGIEISSKIISTASPKCEGDTIGALVSCYISGLPAGLGEPVYDKFSARLAYAMLSINAAKGFEIGAGFKSASMSGSEYHDIQDRYFAFKSNHDGGVQAGITNGQQVYFNVAFKPIPSVRFDRETIDFQGNKTIMKGSNRNDVCVAPRVLPIVEAMAAIVTLDFILINNNK